MQPKYLAHAVLHNEKIWRTSIISLDADNDVSIDRFIQEVPGTVFVSGIICVCNSERLTEAHRKQLAHIVTSARLIETAIRKANKYMSANSLYMQQAENQQSSSPVILPLSRK